MISRSRIAGVSFVVTRPRGTGVALERSGRSRRCPEPRQILEAEHDEWEAPCGRPQRGTMRRTVALLLVSAVVSALVLADTGEGRADDLVYIIAHRCNDTGEPKAVVENRGVNAIEADFTYGRVTVFSSDKWVVNHDGVYVDSDELGPWLDSVATAPATLSLMIFDIKSPEGPIDQLYTAARARAGLANVYLLFSIGGALTNGTASNFSKLKTLVQNDPKAGVAIDETDTPADVQAFFQSEGYQRFWYGDGTFAGGTSSRVTTNVNAGLAMRGCGIKGVYTWTYEDESVIKSWLNAGVNGIFLNATECNGYASPATAWTAEEAIAYVGTLSNRTYATRSHNPFPAATGCQLYVDSEAAAGGSGAQTSPLNSLATALTLAGNGTTLFLRGRATPYHSGSITKPVQMQTYGGGTATIQP